jgi:hypothetical protein
LRALHTCEIAQDRRTNFVKSKFLIDIFISSMNINEKQTSNTNTRKRWI